MCRHRQTQSRRYYKIQWIIQETFSNVVTQDQQSVRRSKKGYKKCDWVTALTILCKERCEIELNWHTSASIAIGILAVAEASEEIISRQRVFKVSECPRDYQTYSKWIIINLSGCLHGSIVSLLLILLFIIVPEGCNLNERDYRLREPKKWCIYQVLILTHIIMYLVTGKR